MVSKRKAALTGVPVARLKNYSVEQVLVDRIEVKSKSEKFLELHRAAANVAALFLFLFCSTFAGVEQMPTNLAIDDKLSLQRMFRRVREHSHRDRQGEQA